MDNSKKNVLYSKLGRRILIYFLLLGFLPLALFSFTMYYQVSNFFHRETVSVSKSYVRLTSSQIFQILKQGEFKFKRNLESFTSGSQPSSYFRRVDRLDSTSPSAWREISEDQELLLQRGEIVLTAPYELQDNFTVALLGKNKEGEIIGAEFEPEILWQAIRGSFYGPDDIVLVLFGDQVIARSTQNYDRSKIPAALFSEIEADGLSRGDFEFDSGSGVYWLSKSLWLAGRYGEHTWHVLIMRPRVTVEAPAKSLLRILLIFLAVATLLIIYFSLRLSRRIFVPVKELSESLESMANGFWFAPLENAASDELGEMVANFNLMGKKLKTEAVYLTKIIGKMSDTVLVADSETTICRMNGKLLKALGYSRDQLRGKKLADIFKEGGNNDFPFDKENLDKLSREKPDQLVLHYKRKTGEDVKVYLRYDIVRDSEGNPDAIILVGTVPELLGNDF